MTWIILSYALSIRDSYIPASGREDKGWKIDDMLQARRARRLAQELTMP